MRMVLSSGFDAYYYLALATELKEKSVIQAIKIVSLKLPKTQNQTKVDYERK